MSEKSLRGDVSTRWNSTLAMCESIVASERALRTLLPERPLVEPETAAQKKLYKVCGILRLRSFFIILLGAVSGERVAFAKGANQGPSDDPDWHRDGGEGKTPLYLSCAAHDLLCSHSFGRT